MAKLTFEIWHFHLKNIRIGVEMRYVAVSEKRKHAKGGVANGMCECT